MCHPSTIDGKDAFFVGKTVKDQRKTNSGKNMSLLLTLIVKRCFFVQGLFQHQRNPKWDKNVSLHPLLMAKMNFCRGNRGSSKKSKLQQKCVTPSKIDSKNGFFSWAKL